MSKLTVATRPLPHAAHLVTLVCLIALTLALPASASALALRVNFQPMAVPIPATYTPDVGGAFTVERGFGWVRQDSLGAAHEPLDLTPNTRDRNVLSDQTLDTLIHMQYPSVDGLPGNVTTPGAWEAVVPNGTYTVTVSAGDAAANYDSTHTIQIEHTVAINAFTPTSATRNTTVTRTTTVTDGRLTINAAGGTNTKLDAVTIMSVDTTAPAAPTGLSAVASNQHVTLDWSDGAEPDLAGYRVYRSTSLPVPTTGTPLTGAAPITASTFIDATATSGTTWYYVVTAVDGDDNESAASQPANATPTTPPAPLDLRVNFQPMAVPIPATYTPDVGGAFTVERGFGWVRQDSLGTTHEPLDLTPNTRDRNVLNDQTLDTLIHMQYPSVDGLPGNVTTPGAWEAVVPNGTYTVTVSAGDAAANYDSTHTIQIEHTLAVDAFTPTSATRTVTVTRTATVADGRLTINAAGGTNTKLDAVTITTASAHPSVTSSTPAAGATNVLRDTAVTAEVHLPTSGANIDVATLTSANVQLTRQSDGAVVPAHLNTSGGGDVIVLKPTDLLDAQTTYRFTVTSGLKDLAGASFDPYSSTFTTGSGATPPPTGDIEFEQVALPTAQSLAYTSVTFGPDGKLYAATLTGQIVRWSVGADGVLGAAQVIESLRTANGGNRTVLGLAFDPASTASNLVLWVTNNEFAFTGATDWSGKVTRLSGPDLGTVQDWIVGLPRSVQDHETNSIAFGPDGAMYVMQGSNSAMGAPDNAWGQRSEHLLSGAVLRVDVDAVASPPLNVKTADGGTYDPWATNAPVTLYATGLRNGFDLRWHSNGHLYVPTNGSAAGGSTPATPTTLPSACARRTDQPLHGAYLGPQVPGLTDVSTAQSDITIKVTPGGYYGHPNPTRCEWVLFGGNPTAGTDRMEIPDYPVGTLPDRNWRPDDIFDMGLHFSPNGVVEYTSDRFAGALAGKLLVVRYSAGDDIVVLDPSGPDGAIESRSVGIPGLTGLVDPLDLTENPATGDLYVTELGGQRITLLRPVDSAGAGTGSASELVASRSRVLLNDVAAAAGSSPTRTIRLDNHGDAPLTITSLEVTGTARAEFALAPQPVVPLTVAPGSSVTVGVSFTAASVGVRTAQLEVRASNATPAELLVPMRGLGTTSEEPSLQRIVDVAGYGTQVGDGDPSNASMLMGGLLGDEVAVDAFQRSGTGPVTIEPLGPFGPTGPGGPDGIAGTFGWMTNAAPDDRRTAFSITNAQVGLLDPAVSGSLAFDPGPGAFSMWSQWPNQANRLVYQQDTRNTFANALPHHVRIYPARTASGAVMPHTYLLGFELITEYADFNDMVFVLHNVDPA